MLGHHTDGTGAQLLSAPCLVVTDSNLPSKVPKLLCPTSSHIAGCSGMQAKPCFSASHTVSHGQSLWAL